MQKPNDAAVKQAIKSTMKAALRTWPQVPYPRTIAELRLARVSVLTRSR
jgi:hypothetical protein